MIVILSPTSSIFLLKREKKGCFFSGILPESIGNLNHLVFFVLVDSFFSGNIPPSLSNLTQLSFLGLRKNNFTGTIPLLISMPKLKILELSYNNFEKGRDYNWIGKLTSLEELYLDGMNIHQEILPSLANLTKLSVVSVAENFIFGCIPSSFMNLTQLTIVTLHHNQLHGPIPSAFSNFKSLKVIDLKGNNFNGKVDLDKFLSLNTLERLYLEGISLVTSENYTNGTLPQLSELGLSSCELKELTAFLRFQMKMIALYLTNNKIGGVIPSWILNNNKKTMIFIDLSYNKLIGEIPPLICQVESLGFLDLSSNSLTGTLPTCLGNLRSLMYLNLKRNKFHGIILDTFTRESPLMMIDFSENRFTGPLPKSIATCTNLEVLSIRDNSFDGAFPFWLGTLTQLQVLILRSNRFSSAILAPSTSSSEFPKLRILDLSNNGFSGHLPDKYFKIWTAMKSLYAGNSSTMTFELSSGSYFTYTSYSMSIINKGVKTDYQTILKIFTAIDLSCNSFEGKIPQSLASIQGLESLNLSNNHLTGYVLPSLGNLKNLESLDLSHNELSGKIPQELLQLGFLAMFNVSFNHLEGRIPTGKQFDTFENNSYVDNPLLCGQPLSNDCRGSTTSTPSQTSDEHESFLPYEIIDWVVIFLSFGSGLVIGILLGTFLYARYHDCFERRFGMTKDTSVRPLGYRRRN
ncbi:receptor-like protein 53 [Rutidosis leptorrhynchoides]|uniref:receptor-like protein 53 n=1 Tax=Rutidosis leptorrhynchoides TaxID=125765 RepID=UPI003A999520